MKNLSVLLGLTLVLAAAQDAGAAAPKASELVQAQLLADASAVKPGEEFTLGVLLKIKPKWHIYWKHPGDSGMPTSVEWKLPGGSAEQPKLRFPLPVRFDQPGDVIGYGYKDEVLLTARVKAPQGPVGSSHEYVADVSYLVCEDVCIPGDATAKLSIPLAEQTAPANQELFEKWTKQFPLAASADSRASPIKDTKIQISGERQLQAKVNWADNRPPSDVQWFPVPPKGVGVEDAQTSTEGSGSVLSFALVPMPKEASKMQFLVTYTDSNGKRQGVEFDENLPAPLPK